MKTKKSVKLAIVSTHAIQYYSPWFRFLAEGRLEDGRPQPQHAGGWAASRWEMGDGGGEVGGRKSVVGGHPSAISDLPSAKKPEGFEFEVFYAHRQTAKGQAVAGFGVEFQWDVPVLEGYPHRFLENVSKRPGTDWFGGCDCPEIGEILVREGFTHVLLIGWHKKVFWQAFWAAKKAGIPVFCRGDSQLEMTQGRLKRAVKFAAYRFLLPRFDAHLFVGQRNFAYLRHYGVPKDRLFFSPHFVDNQWWQERSQSSGKMGDGRSPQPQHAGGWATATPSKIGGSQPPNSHLPTAISEKRTAFLFAGKFIPKKRVMDLLEAAAVVLEARVVLVGDGPLRPQLEERAGRPDLNGRVEFAGFKNQQELPAYLAGADCLVLPSDGTETWGLIVNEAMACGTPAIVSEACGCAPDLIEEGKTGFSFPLGNTGALSKCMQLFIEKGKSSFQNTVSEKIRAYSMNEATRGLHKVLEMA
jgi:glycosyltransferase involved in cell wall biosynthesis